MIPRPLGLFLCAFGLHWWQHCGRDMSGRIYYVCDRCSKLGFTPDV